MKKEFFETDFSFAFVFTIIYWVIGIINFFMGGIKNISTIYGILLAISLFLPSVYCLLLKLNIWPFPFGFTVGAAIIYLPIVGSIALCYNFQSFSAFLLLLVLVLVIALFCVFYAIYKTLKSKENSFYIYEIDNKKYQASFFEAFWNYFLCSFAQGLVHLLDIFF